MMCCKGIKHSSPIGKTSKNESKSLIYPGLRSHLDFKSLFPSPSPYNNFKHFGDSSSEFIKQHKLHNFSASEVFEHRTNLTPNVHHAGHLQRSPVTASNLDLVQHIREMTDIEAQLGVKGLNFLDK